jgi:recombinational DNA repair ATPase RecF
MEPAFTQAEQESYLEAGCVDRMLLTNFLCHHSLEVVFCPGVNFIIGENGSGKSAILTALCVALVRAAAAVAVRR